MSDSFLFVFLITFSLVSFFFGAFLGEGKGGVKVQNAIKNNCKESGSYIIDKDGPDLIIDCSVRGEL